VREGPSGQVKDGEKGRDGTEVYEDGLGGIAYEKKTALRWFE